MARFNGALPKVALIYVQAITKIAIRYEPVTVVGKMQVLDNDKEGMYYRMTEAVQRRSERLTAWLHCALTATMFSTVSRFTLILLSSAVTACSMFTEVHPPFPEELVSTQEYSRPLEDVSACLITAFDRQSYGSAQPTTTKRSTPTGEQIVRWFASKNVYERQTFVLVRVNENRIRLTIYVQPRSGEHRLGRFGNLAIAAAQSCG
jgi:hypothetical protein